MKRRKSNFELDFGDEDKNVKPFLEGVVGGGGCVLRWKDIGCLKLIGLTFYNKYLFFVLEKWV